MLLGSTDALEHSFANGFAAAALGIPLGGAVIAFSMWWLYFCEAEHLRSTDIKHAFVWGYGHFLVFASGAAAGAGLGVMLDASTDGHEPANLVALSVSLPVAAYVAGLWLVRDRHLLGRRHGWVLLLFAGLIAATGVLPWGPTPTALTLLVALVVRLRSSKR